MIFRGVEIACIFLFTEKKRGGKYDNNCRSNRCRLNSKNSNGTANAIRLCFATLSPYTSLFLGIVQPRRALSVIRRGTTVEWGTNGHGENKSECAETGMVESPILVEFSFSTFKIYTCLLQRNDRFLFQAKYTSFSRFRAIIGLELFLYVQFQSINYS